MATQHQTGVLTFEGHKVYDALFVKEKAPTYFVGCTSVLKVIVKKHIPDDQIFYASYGKTGYKRCSAEYTARKLLIKADWVEKNVAGFGVKPAPPPGPTKPTKTYQPAPPILHLDESEMFRDEHDVIVKMEVRGERHWKKIWFKARDVEKMLELVDISTLLTGSTSAYTYGKDYETFQVIAIPQNPGDEGGKKPGVFRGATSMFLSYSGLIRVLINRRHPIAEKFQDWAYEKLFTLQHGTYDAKEELVADVLGVTPKALKAVLNTNVTCMPAIYLFHLGSVKALRATLSISDKFDDNATVYKFGRSDNLQRRTGEHEATFGKLPNVDLRLKHHVYIDPLYTTEAEADIKRYFTAVEWVLEHEQYTELAIVPAKLEYMVREKFVMIGKCYAGKLEELQGQLANERRVTDELRKHMQAQEALYNTNTELYKELLKAKDEVIKAKDAQLATVNDKN
jgi:hypothetical protein